MKAKIINPLLNRFTPLRYATPGSAGLDLVACIPEAITLWPGDQRLIGSGLAVHIENPHLAGLLMIRSSLGKQGLTLANSVGLIDSDYQDEIGMLLCNWGQVPYTLQPGERIAQLVIVPVMQVELEFMDNFEPTERTGGFGSTGQQ